MDWTHHKTWYILLFCAAPKSSLISRIVEKLPKCQFNFFWLVSQNFFRYYFCLREKLFQQKESQDINLELICLYTLFHLPIFHGLHDRLHELHLFYGLHNRLNLLKKYHKIFTTYTLLCGLARLVVHTKQHMYVLSQRRYVDATFFARCNLMEHTFFHIPIFVPSLLIDLYLLLFTVK